MAYAGADASNGAHEAAACRDRASGVAPTNAHRHHRESTARAHLGAQPRAGARAADGGGCAGRQLSKGAGCVRVGGVTPTMMIGRLAGVWLGRRARNREQPR